MLPPHGYLRSRGIKSENDRLPFMACCYVEITGTDGATHFLTTEAASTYDAIQQAITSWCMFSWWNPSAIAIVKCNDQTWKISVRKVLEKRSVQSRRRG